MFKINVGENIPATTWGLPQVLMSGGEFTPRVRTNSGPGPDYWVEIDPVKVPVDHVALVTWGNPTRIGSVRVIPADTRKAKKAIKAFNQK